MRLWKLLPKMELTVAGVACGFEDLKVSAAHEVGLCKLPDGVHFLTEKSSSLFVRDFYADLYTVTMAKKTMGSVNAIVCGSAGIGKSWMAMYFLVRLAKEKKKVIFEHIKLGKAFVFDFSDGGAPPRELRVYSRGDIVDIPEASDPEAFYLVDAGEKNAPVDAAPVDAFTVIFASPFDGHFKGSLKRMNHGGRFFVPCLAESEALQMCELVPHVTAAEVQERFAFFGGITRHLFAPDTAKECGECESALAVCDLPKAIKMVEGRTVVDDMSHFILHASADRQTFEQGGAHFASKHVAMTVACRATLEEIHDLQRQARIDTPMTRFEMLVHRTLVNGGKFKARRLGSTKEEKDIVLPPMAVKYFRYFDDCLKGLGDNEYGIATSSRQPSADGVFRSGGAAAIVQATIAADHPINVPGLLTILRGFGVNPKKPGKVNVPFYFVVPAKIAAKYKVQKFTAAALKTGAKGKKPVAASDPSLAAVEQWVIGL
jgi:hypothetical protein